MTDESLPIRMYHVVFRDAHDNNINTHSCTATCVTQVLDALLATEIIPAKTQSISIAYIGREDMKRDE